ncbi:MAG: RDD family protein [Dehalococcoidales bacterium]|nr:RDD family protein [Dehalococcoidales bacterium]
MENSPATEDTALKPPGKKVCTACGTINYSSSIYCYKCGAELPGQVDDRVEAPGNPAGFWVRSLAFVIDRTFLVIIGVALVVVFTGTSLAEALAQYFDLNRPVSGGEYLIGIGTEITYWTLTTGTWGKTIGKAMLRLKVTRVDGSRLTYARAFARYWAYYVSILTLGLGFIAIALSSKKRGFHDFICDTKVSKQEV